jgi:NADH-quinone oxidoreductase subunit K
MVPLYWYLYLGSAVFFIGMGGFLVRRNVIHMLLGIELMLNGVNINLVALSHYMQDLRGQILTLFVIAVAAAEAAVGLALVVTLFRNKQTVHMDEVKEMKG